MSRRLAHNSLICELRPETSWFFVTDDPEREVEADLEDGTVGAELEVLSI